MKKLKFLMFAFTASLLFTACNEEAGRDTEDDTVIIREKETVRETEPVREETTKEEKDVNFEIKRDKDGGVSGGVSGGVDTDDDDR